MNQETLETLILDLIDGSIGSEDFIVLENELRSNPEAIETYVALSRVENLLHVKSEINKHVFKSVIPMESILKKQRSKTIKIALLSTATALLLVLVVMNLVFVENDEPTLVFKTSPGTQFSLAHSSDRENTEGLILEQGSRLKLTQGVVELTFKSGVKSIIIAPTDITLLQDNILKIDQGTAWFEVPKGAEGFTVHTKDLKIVDLGTEFGVLAKAKNHDEIHVFKGKVEVSAKRLRMESATLVAGEARRIDPIGRLNTIDSKPTTFLTSLPKSLPYLHWSFDEVEGGGFAADGEHSNLEGGFAMPSKAQARSMLVSGRFGKAVRFTGKMGEEILTEWPGISGDKPRTIACWIRISPQSLNPNGSAIAVWGKDKYASPGWVTKWKLAIAPDGKPIVVGYNGGFAGITYVADNQWHHIACTHEMSAQGDPVVTMFVDGNQVENIWRPLSRSKTGDFKTVGIPNTLTTQQHSRPLQMGQSLNNTAPIRGEIDELYIFEGALDAQTIQRLATDNQHQP